MGTKLKLAPAAIYRAIRETPKHRRQPLIGKSSKREDNQGSRPDTTTSSSSPAAMSSYRPDWRSSRDHQGGGARLRQDEGREWPQQTRGSSFQNGQDRRSGSTATGAPPHGWELRRDPAARYFEEGPAGGVYIRPRSGSPRVPAYRVPNGYGTQDAPPSYRPQYHGRNPRREPYPTMTSDRQLRARPSRDDQYQANPPLPIRTLPSQSSTGPLLFRTTRQGVIPYRERTPPPKKTKASKKHRDRDPILTPSAKSGGVPDPTEAYLSQTLIAPTRVSEPRPMLLVIDLNGTLLYRPSKHNPKHFVERPFASKFLEYCTKTFWVVIWSSARQENVSAMISRLLPPPPPAGSTTSSSSSATNPIVAAWARDRFGLSPQDFNSRVQCYKRLSLVWADPTIAASHPGFASGRKWDQSNTVLIDDSVEKARSEPCNLVEVPEFLGTDAVEMGGGHILPQVHDYINELCYQSDVSAYMRLHPFQPSEQGWQPSLS